MEKHVTIGDERNFEKFLANMLRTGVLVSGFVVIIGGIIYLMRYGASVPEYDTFRGVPPELMTISGIAKDLVKFHVRTIIQMGLLLLIFTPILRVLFSAYQFARERDWVYIGTTLLVLTMLLFGLLGGHL
jgi:uncharacterized membrane protein